MVTAAARVITSHDRALASAHYDRGNALAGSGRLEEALRSYGQSLALNPTSATALNNCGNVLCALGRFHESLEFFDRALAAQPQFLDAHFNRAITLQSLRRYEEALRHYDHVAAVRADYPRLYLHRANALQALNRLEEAWSSCSIASARNPGDPRVLVCAGDILQRMFKRDAALVYYRKALQIQPEFPYLRGLQLGAAMACCEWDTFDSDLRAAKEGVRRGARCIVPWEFVTLSDCVQQPLQCAQIFAADRCPPSSAPLWKGERYSHERIRVAYLSADFHEHATVCLMAGLFERHDRAQFEIVAVSFSPDRASPLRSRVERAFDTFMDVSAQSDEQIARLLREMEIDIAVDLKGYTGDCRPGIFALRPAPVQVNYLGYPGTMGVGYIDYIIADRIVIPPEDRVHYTENVVYLPDSYQVNDDTRQVRATTLTRTAAGLPEVGFVFCSFNNNYKITPEVFDIWMRLLQRVPGSVLWLFEGNGQVVLNLRKQAQLRNVSPDRLVFAPRMSIEDHLARHRLADLFLDNLPCNAHTTASDALRAGLPMVTCLGSTFAGRVCASLLHAVGVPELIANSLDQYERLALQLATDPRRLRQLREKLTANLRTAPLFDTDLFRRNIERAYRRMWERYRRSEPAASFAVESA